MAKFDSLSGVAFAILLFPTLFQEDLVRLAWGDYDSLLVAWGVRALLVLPVLAIIFGCWLTVGCAISIIIRAKRREFVNHLFVTWWDLLRSIFSFWGGILRFVFYLVGWLFAFARLMVLGLWLAVQDILLSPLRVAKDVGSSYTQAGTPWLAVILLVLWSLLEALIFTFVTTNLVMSVLESVTDTVLEQWMVQLPLYCMMFAFVLGSYAIVSTLEQAVRSRDVKQIALIGVIEFVTMVFEVTFLYREFVDALVPWFAQHSGGEFQLGLFGTLAIAGTAWAGIRGMTWFLFASSGTPTIMAIIQRTGLRQSGGAGGGADSKEQFKFIRKAIEKIMEELEWVHKKGDEILSAFILPPLQIVAACVNFCTLFISTKPLFDLPFKSFKDLMGGENLFKRARVE